MDATPQIIRDEVVASEVRFDASPRIGRIQHVKVGKHVEVVWWWYRNDGTLYRVTSAALNVTRR